MRKANVKQASVTGWPALIFLVLILLGLVDLFIRVIEGIF